MHRLVEVISGLGRDPRFAKFQNDTVQCLYTALGKSYSAGEGEVDMVTNLVAAANGQGYGPIRLLAKKIHGSTSYVNFNFRDKPTTREFGDMVVITVVTAGRTRLFQRMSIIQNKKSSGKSWAIDDEQLFLLKNFPPISGTQGTFSGDNNRSFPNKSRCLGAFGLLDAPGEMLFVSAPLVAEMLRGKKSLNISDVSAQQVGQSLYQAGVGALPWVMSLDSRYLDELHFLLRHASKRYGLPYLGCGTDFIGNTLFARDIYDFVRAWTQFNIGEVTYAWDAIVNAEVDALANFLIRAAGFGDIFDISENAPQPNTENIGDYAVAIMHLDVANG